MKEDIKIILPVYPSGNKYKGRYGDARYFGFKKKVKRLLKDYNLAAPKEIMKADVTIVRHGSRLLDQDNLHFGSKPIQDVLRDLGFFPDDNPKWISVTWLQVKCCRLLAKTEVVIKYRKDD
jgi:hypothetical protein